MSIAANIIAPQEVWEKQPEPFLWNGLTFTPRYNHYSNITGYSGKLDNMYLSLSLSGLYITNSWHKFFTHGNNFTDYTSKDVAETFYILNDQLKGSLNETAIKKISYGVLIDAEPDFKEWFIFKTKTTQPMIDKGTVYGSKFQLTDYSIKAYDKSFEVKRHNGVTIPRLYRIEKEVSYMKHLYNRKHPINICQAYDLTNPEIFRQLGEDFIQTYLQIEKIRTMNLKGLSIHELNVIATMQNQFVRKHLKQENNRTYKKYQKEYKVMQRDLISDNDVQQKIIEKVNLLTGI